VTRLPLLAAAVLLPLAAAAAQSSGSAQALAARAGLRLEELNREAERLAAEARTLLGDLRKLEVDRQIRAEEFRRADADAGAAAAELAALEAEIAGLEQEEVTEAPVLRARLVELYKLGQGRYVRLLLNTADAEHFGEAARMVSALARRDRQRIEAHQRRLSDLAARREAAAERSRRLAAHRAEAARAQAAAERAVRERDALIRDIDRRRDLTAQLAGELQLARQKLQLALRDNGNAAAGATPGAGGAADAALPLRPFRGAIDWPVSGPGVALRRRFQAPVAGTPSNGIEIRAPEGTPVHAIHGGGVAFADTFAGYGKLVILDHGGGTFSLYGYLLDLAVAKGDRLAAGQALGATGVGVGGEAGLYFELRIDGRPVDPLQWLKRAGAP
jgi:septal ring factor EnvC (AmiA/AmiB activator)